MSEIEKDRIEISLMSLKKTKELIYYGIQLTNAVQRGTILPQHFEKCLIVPEPHSNKQFLVELDWEKHPEVFTLTADDALIHIANYAIIVCKESYSKTFWVDESKNSDLYVAQTILKLLRDAFGHMRAESKNYAAPYWDINQKSRKLFEIKELGIVFDMRNLHSKQFQFSHLGGLTNFLRVLNYLIKDLEQRLLPEKEKDSIS